MTTRTLEINKPRFTAGEKKELMDGNTIEMFGVTITYLKAGKWFRLEGKSIQIVSHVLAILTGRYAGE